MGPEYLKSIHSDGLCGWPKGRIETVLLYVLNAVSDGVIKVVSWIVACFMSGMAIAILLAITSRFIIKIPIPWTEELSRYLMVWVAFLAGSLGFKRGVHVGVLFVVKRVPGSVAKWIGLITNTALLVFFLVLIIEGFQMATLVADQMSPVLRISMAWVYSSLPVGAVIFTLFVIQSIIENLKGLRKRPE